MIRCIYLLVYHTPSHIHQYKTNHLKGIAQPCHKNRTDKSQEGVVNLVMQLDAVIYLCAVGHVIHFRVIYIMEWHMVNHV